MITQRQTLRRRERIRAKKDFEKVFSLRQVIRAEPFDLYYETSGDVRRQLGLTVSKKVARKATERARIKRRFREVFRRNKNRLSERTRVILRAKPPAKAYNYSELEKLFCELAERIQNKRP